VSAIISLTLPPPLLAVSPRSLLPYSREIIRARPKKGLERCWGDIGMPLYIIYLSNPYFELLKTSIRKKHNWRKDVRIARRPLKSLLKTC